MLQNMQSMRSMMQSMQTFVEKTMSTHGDDISHASAFRDSRQTYSDDESPGPSSTPASPDAKLLTQPSKRNRTPISKGQSPASKLTHTGGGRNGGRERGRGAARGSSPPRRSARNQPPVSTFAPTEFDPRKTAPTATFDPTEFNAQTNTKFDPMQVSEPSKIHRQTSTPFAAASTNRYDPLDDTSSGSV